MPFDPDALRRLASGGDAGRRSAGNVVREAGQRGSERPGILPSLAAGIADFIGSRPLSRECHRADNGSTGGVRKPPRSRT